MNLNYNQEEGLATCYTQDKALIRKLDQLCQKHKEITLVRGNDYAREYTFPKKWIKVRAPRQLSDEKRSELKDRARKNFHGEIGGEDG